MVADQLVVATAADEHTDVRKHTHTCSIAITTTARPENIIILLRYFGWWPHLF